MQTTIHRYKHIYMHVPVGFRGQKVHPKWNPFGVFTIILLTCCLYGLVQAAYEFWQVVERSLLAHGFRKSASDDCLFVIGELGSDNYLACALWVDDFMPIIYAREGCLLRFCNILSAAGLDHKVSQQLTEGLGMQIDYSLNNGTMTFSHKSYIEGLVKKAQDLVGRKGVMTGRSVPIRPATVKALSMEEKPCTWEKWDDRVYRVFRSILGAVAHVSNWSRPDVAYAVSYVSQYMSYPQQQHLDAVWEILEYLHSTKDKVITFRRRADAEVTTQAILGLCDADLGGDKRTGRSRTGYLFYLFGNLVAWQAKLQPSVSLSTAEAEYQSTCAAAQFGVWFRRVVTDIGILSAATAPVTIMNDNKSAIAIASTPAMAARSRHFNLRVHWLKQVVRDGEIRVVFVCTDANTSDALTKALSHAKLIPFRDQMLLGFTLRADVAYRSISTLEGFDMSSFHCVHSGFSYDLLEAVFG